MAPLKKKKSTETTDLGMMDVSYLVLTLLLTAVGLLMLYSASYARAYYEEEGDSAYYFKSQLVYAAAGIFIMWLFSRVPYEWYQRLSPVIYVVSVLLVAAVLVVGSSANGATRWLNLGFFSFQPSEVAKFALIIILSAILSSRQKYVKNPSTLFLCLGAAALLILPVMLEPHFSATIILGCVTLVLLLVGGADKKRLIFIGLLAAGGLLVLILSKGYSSDRLTAWLHPEDDPLDTGLQILQSQYAIGSGGLLGLGFGKSRQKFLYLPEEHNDYIFSIVCEELGYLGVLCILTLFALWIIRGFWIAMHARDRFSMLMALGLTTLHATQVILNVAVVTNMLPSTGISMPFFSSGGTALIMQLAECGMMLNISRSFSSIPKRKESKA